MLWLWSVLTHWPMSMFFKQNRRKRLHKNRVQFPEDYLGTPTWLPFLCLGTPTWLPWRHVKKTLWDVARVGLCLIDIFCRFVQTWVFKGVCNDMFGEFMIETDEQFLAYRGKQNEHLQNRVDVFIDDSGKLGESPSTTNRSRTIAGLPSCWRVVGASRQKIRGKIHTHARRTSYKVNWICL